MKAFIEKLERGKVVFRVRRRSKRFARQSGKVLEIVPTVIRKRRIYGIVSENLEFG